MVDSSIWDQEIAAPASVISFVDENVLKGKGIISFDVCFIFPNELLSMDLELPKDSRVVSISPYGASHWTRSAEIKTIDSTGDKVSFFMKVTHIIHAPRIKAYISLCDTAGRSRRYRQRDGARRVPFHDGCS